MVNKHPNTMGLLNHASKKKKTQYRVNEVIQLMIKDGQKSILIQFQKKPLFLKHIYIENP